MIWELLLAKNKETLFFLAIKINLIHFVKNHSNILLEIIPLKDALQIEISLIFPFEFMGNALHLFIYLSFCEKFILLDNHFIGHPSGNVGYHIK